MLVGFFRCGKLRSLPCTQTFIVATKGLALTQESKELYFKYTIKKNN